MKKPLILIDGSSYLFRAYHALPALTTSSGQPTGAIYGVINMLRKLIKEYDPEHIAVVFDSRGKTTRHKLYPQYKANRPKMPEELACQIQPLHTIIEAMGLPLIRIQGIEADDIIGTLTRDAENKGMSILISTGDKDMAQLVNEHVTLVNTMTDKVQDREGVIEKFGVTPEQIVDYLALMGDSVDNIPGVPKVGPKTAAKWLQEYSTLDNIMAHANDIGGKIGENLRNHLEQLPLSRTLTTIMCDLKLDVSPDSLTPSPPDEEALMPLFQELEFHSWLRELSPSNDNTAQSYVTVLTKQALNTAIKEMKAAHVFSFDTETTSLNPIDAELVGISLSSNANTGYYAPVGHDYDDAPKQLQRDHVLTAIKSLLEDPKKVVVGQNLKYDINVLKKYNINVQAHLFDTMLESYVLNSTSSRHDMDTLALKHLGRETVHFEDIAGKGKAQLTFNQVPIEAAAHYAAEDADITLQLHEALWPQVNDTPSLKKIFSEIEMPLMPVLADIEYKGVLIDNKPLEQQSKQLAKRIGELEQEVCSLAGETFNLSSTKQLQTILYEKLNLPVLKKTPKGQPSTAEPVLQELAADYPIPKLILEYRSLSKLKSTYTDKLPEQINSHTGRVHTSYNQAVAVTGRLSSTDPNLQNIPVRTEEGRRIRQAFIAPENYKIVSADYSQVELRIMAHYSEDESLLKAFAQGLDIHRATASEVFGTPYDDVTDEQRRRAKAINFGLLYGMSAFGLARQLDVDRNTAQEYMDIYFQRYPGAAAYMENSRKNAHKNGYVETLYGRRLYLPDINASNRQRQMAAERAAINAPMQGTAADIIKIAMIRLHNALKDSTIDASIIMQVHDELVFEVHKDAVEALNPLINEHMCHTTELKVPLIVKIGVGDNWDEAH